MTILIVAGDPSGDLHGSHLAKALKLGGAKIAAVGGSFLKKEADEFIEDLASCAITGFWEPLAKLGFLLRLGLRLKSFLADEKPAAIVCVDYYGFNRYLLGFARAAGVPAYYFISPQVWASRPSRVAVLKRSVKKMLVIFPFEEKIYNDADVPVAFVGHPLLDLIHEPAARPPLRPPFTIGLLPGSRASEVRRHLPVFLEALRLIQARFPGSQALLFASPHLPDEAYAPAFGKASLIRDSGYEHRQMLDIVLTSSGTATLENALLGLPMVVIYKMSWLTYAVARTLIRVKHIAMANILAGKTLVPELVQQDATPERVAQAAAAILCDPRRHATLRQDLLSLRHVLGERGATKRAAKEILQSLEEAAR